MCHLKVELDFLSLKINVVICVLYVSRRCLWSTVYVGACSFCCFIFIFVQNISQGCLSVYWIYQLSISFNDVTLLVTVRLGRGNQLRPSPLSFCLSLMLMFSFVSASWLIYENCQRNFPSFIISKVFRKKWLSLKHRMSLPSIMLCTSPTVCV